MYSVKCVFTNINKKEESIPLLQALAIGAQVYVLGPDGQPRTNDKIQCKTIPEGAATTVAAAFDTRLKAIPRAYLCESTEANKDVAAPSSDPVSERRKFESRSFVANANRDMQVNAEELWTLPEEIIGEKFAF
ncbi:hypothetical protein C8R47DRAFT_1083475 [Mycena vitilis]|nr:hypothetical protein C8R47DRAFT_1083475 [Mycena vitilis]